MRRVRAIFRPCSPMHRISRIPRIAHLTPSPHIIEDHMRIQSKIQVCARCSQTRVRPPRASARPRHGRGLASSLPVPAHGFLCFSCRGQSAAPIVNGKTYMTHQTDICERYRITLRCGPPIPPILLHELYARNILR